MTVVEMRRGTTKGDVREHWHEQVVQALLFCMVMFLALLMFGTVALITMNFLLVCVCGVLLLAETTAAGRMAFCMYKYWCTMKPCRKV